MGKGGLGGSKLHNQKKFWKKLEDYRRPCEAQVLLGGNGGGGVPVGVVDQSVEGLIDPLPEDHSRNCPETEQKLHGNPAATRQDVISRIL